MAKVSSDRAKPNGVLWVLPGQEARFLARLDVRSIPGVGKVLEKSLHDLNIYKVGDLAGLEECFLDECFGKWGLTLAGKARDLDAGGWFDSEIGASEQPKSISHEHTFSEDTADAEQFESTLARLTEMVCRRLREHGLYARTVHLKLRYKDFSTITRARSLRPATQVDGEILVQVRELFRANWKAGTQVRLLGVHTSSFEAAEGQLGLLDGDKRQRWQKALSATDQLRDKYGEGAISLATGLKGRFRERTHKNPGSLPGKHPEDRHG